MPPRASKYDSATIVAALTTQVEAVRATVRSLRSSQLDQPTRLAGWTVRELVAHLTLVVDGLPRHLLEPEPAKPELTLTGWALSTAAAAAKIDADTRALAASGSPFGDLDTAVRRFSAALPYATKDRVIVTRVGPMDVADYLVTRLVELVVHSDDLTDATRLDILTDRQGLAVTTRLLTDALVARAPGGAVELRVPPFAAVQCVAGPRHTRGTPPSVVEADARTWIRLATGRLSWSDARSRGLLQASGERCDLSDLLPVLS